MLKSKLWVSIVEAIIVVFILSFGIYWLFDIFITSSNLSSHTQKKIEWLAIAREWIEAMQNIRDTNWNKFSTDYKNCWNSFNYNSSCNLMSWNLSRFKIPKWNYSITNDSLTDWRWLLTPRTSTAWFENSSYRNEYLIYKSPNWYYYQDNKPTPSASISGYTKTAFTRRIKIDYCLTTDNATCNQWLSASENRKIMLVTSIVEWQDSSKSETSKIELQTMLTNYIDK
jgi:hypothetical protein